MYSACLQQLRTASLPLSNAAQNSFFAFFRFSCRHWGSLSKAARSIPKTCTSTQSTFGSHQHRRSHHQTLSQAKTLRSWCFVICQLLQRNACTYVCTQLGVKHSRQQKCSVHFTTLQPRFTQHQYANWSTSTCAPHPVHDADSKCFPNVARNAQTLGT